MKFVEVYVYLAVVTHLIGGVRVQRDKLALFTLTWWHIVLFGLFDYVESWYYRDNIFNVFLDLDHHLICA